MRRRTNYIILLVCFISLILLLFIIKKPWSFFEHAAGSQTILPQVISMSSPDVTNPFRGFFKWNSQEIAPLSSDDSYIRFKWSDLETTQGTYNFTAIDQALADAQARGGKFGFRVYALWDQHGALVPPYLVGSGKGYWLNWSTKALCTQGTTGCDTYVPDWNDPVLLSRMQALFTALANKYKNDPRLGFIDVGMYGAYGEWHMSGYPTNPGNGWVPASVANQKQIVDLQVNAFNSPTFTKIFVIPGGTSQIDTYFLQKSQKYGLRKDDLAATDMDNWPNLNDWLLQTYGATSTNLANTNPVFSGTDSLEFTSGSSFDGIVFRWTNQDPFDLSPYTTVHFAIHAAQTTAKLSLMFVCSGTPACPKITLTPNPSSTSWTVYDLPLANFSATGRQITGIQIQDETNSGTTQETYFLDELGFGTTSNPKSYLVYDDHLTGAFNDYISNRWQTAPVISEFYGESYPPAGIQDLARADLQVKTYHSSMIGNGNFYNNIPAASEWGDLTTTQQGQMTQLGKDAGFRYTLNSVTLPVQTNAGDTLTISSQWSNQGDAPVYAPWNVMWQLRDPISHAVVWQAASSLNLQTLLPTGTTPQTATDTFQLPSNLAPNVYTFAVQVVDPTSYEKPLALAITGQQADGSYTLGSITIPQVTIAPTTNPSPTVVSGNATSPIKIAWFNKQPSTSTMMQSILSKYSFLSLSKTETGNTMYTNYITNSTFTNKSTNKATMYVVSLETQGPGRQLGLDANGHPFPIRNNTLDSCSNTNFINSPWQNNMAWDFKTATNDYCASLHQHEDWFLHNNKGERLYYTVGGNIWYIMNPRSTGWRTYAANWILHEMNCDSNFTVTPCYDGVFFDNVYLSVSRALNGEAGTITNATGALQETYYKTTDDLTNPCTTDDTTSVAVGSVEFRCSERWYLNAVAQAVHSVHKFIWGNMVGPWPASDTGQSWNIYMNGSTSGFAGLDGGMEEGLILWSDTTWPTEADWNKKLTQADTVLGHNQLWMGIGRGSADADLLSGSGSITCTTKDPNDSDYSHCTSNRETFALATYLMVADGTTNAEFRYVNDDYTQSIWFDNYTSQLGTPILVNGKPQRYIWPDSSSHLYQSDGSGKYHRDFTCGIVTINVINHTASITVNNALNTCASVPTSTLTPTSKPTNTPTPTPTLTPTPVVLIGDLNLDGKVNLLDVSILLSNYGTTNPTADVNHNGVVDLQDFSILLSNWTG